MASLSNGVQNKALLTCQYLCFLGDLALLVSLVCFFKNFQIKTYVECYHSYIRRSQLYWQFLWFSSVTISVFLWNVCTTSVQGAFRVSCILHFFVSDTFQTKLHGSINNTSSFPLGFLIFFFNNNLHNKLRYQAVIYFVQVLLSPFILPVFFSNNSPNKVFVKQSRPSVIPPL